MNSNMTIEFHAQNIKALQKLKKLDVKLLKFPNDVTTAGKKALQEVIEDLGSKNKDFEKVYTSINKHLELSKEWANVGLKNFLNIR
jgi:TRAP-type mannitol/chloroaromatic compound transport system substrate-binding protein